MLAVATAAAFGGGVAHQSMDRTAVPVEKNIATSKLERTIAVGRVLGVYQPELTDTYSEIGHIETPAKVAPSSDMYLIVLEVEGIRHSYYLPREEQKRVNYVTNQQVDVVLSGRNKEDGRRLIESIAPLGTVT